MVFEKFSECPVQDINNFLYFIPVLLRHKVKDTLQGETLVRACLDLRPYLIIEDVELPEERAVRTLIKAFHGDPVTLDEVLHHLDTFHIRPLFVHEVDRVLPALKEVLLRHLADGVSLVDDVELAHLRVNAVDGEVRPHDAASHKPLLLIGDGIEHRFALRIKCLEIGHDRRGIHQGNLEHPGLLIGDDCIVHRDAAYSDYHRVVFR